MKKKWLAVFLTAAMVAGLMACGKQKPAVTENKENPKVTETNTESNNGESNNTETAPLEFACQVRDGDYNPADVQMYKELEEKTKVKINWTTYSASAWQEKKSLLFASNELPDAFFGQWVLSSDEVVKYGTEGILIPLEDYITEENTPNLYKIFQEYPEYIMNWVDNCYEPLFSVQASLALKVGLHLKDTGNGTYETVLAPTDENKEGVIPGVNTRIFNVSEEAAALLKDCPAHLIEKKELDNYYNDYYYPEYYPQFLFSAEENDKLATLKTEINNYANEKYATWMMNGGIEKEWDSYLKQLDNMGLQEMLSIYQTALDRYKSNLK